MNKSQEQLPSWNGLRAQNDASIRERQKKPLERRRSYPMDSLASSRCKDSCSAHCVAEVTSHRVAALVKDQLSTQLCAELSRAIHSEFTTFLATQADTAARQVEVLRNEIQKMIVMPEYPDYSSESSSSCSDYGTKVETSTAEAMEISPESLGTKHKMRPKWKGKFPPRSQTWSDNISKAATRKGEVRVNTEPALPARDVSAEYTAASSSPLPQSGGDAPSFTSLPDLSHHKRTAPFSTDFSQSDASTRQGGNNLPSQPTSLMSNMASWKGAGKVVPPASPQSPRSPCEPNGPEVERSKERQPSVLGPLRNYQHNFSLSTSEKRRQRLQNNNNNDNKKESRTGTLQDLEDRLGKELFASKDLMGKPGRSQTNTQSYGGSPKLGPQSMKAAVRALSPQKTNNSWSMMSVVPAALSKRRPSDCSAGGRRISGSSAQSGDSSGAASSSGSAVHLSPRGSLKQQKGTPPFVSERSPHGSPHMSERSSLTASPAADAISFHLGIFELDLPAAGVEPSESSLQAPSLLLDGQHSMPPGKVDAYVVHAPQATDETAGSGAPKPPSVTAASLNTLTGFASESSKLSHHGNINGLESVRRLRERQLTRDLTKLADERRFSQEGDVEQIASPDSSQYQSAEEEKYPLGVKLVEMLLRISGAVPFGRQRCWILYPWFVFLLSLLSIGSCAVPIITGHTGRYLSDMAFSLGALAVLLCSGMFRKSISECSELLVVYASNHGFLQLWAHGSSWDALGTFALWLIVVLERWRHFLVRAYADGDGIDFWPAMQIVAFSFASGVIMIWMHYIQYVARGLGSMIDTFVCHFVDSPNFAEAIAEWNVLQAVIRKACRCIQGSFFTLQTITAVAALMSLADVRGQEHSEIVAFLPAALIIIAVTRVFFCAGAVSDKCARVPALVNSLDVGTVLDRDRLYVVDYISHSQAGFYMFEARVTSTAVLKLFYITCVAVLTVATRLVALGD